ncbi:hypothetical protein CUJ84_Chr000921 [Rhizobium leguminosarum]|uniref:Uncharacterized protein n=1 Tax=Rhizobium leguminosarum TaxID=384 RepID=A0A2K9YZM9_RHILE|nr:hypothetical protein CUJ84_Chr000921 [Rhizobium leguminosarum]
MPGKTASHFSWNCSSRARIQMTSNDDILRALGRVEGRLTGIEDNVALLRKEVSDEKANAHDSRAVIHKRLDEQARQKAHGCQRRRGCADPRGNQKPQGDRREEPGGGRAGA